MGKCCNFPLFSAGQAWVEARGAFWLWGLKGQRGLKGSLCLKDKREEIYFFNLELFCFLDFVLRNKDLSFPESYFSGLKKKSKNKI